jgi:TRAP-type C4-dicarboxylate transport system substrate-binding protein
LTLLRDAQTMPPGSGMNPGLLPIGSSQHKTGDIVATSSKSILVETHCGMRQPGAARAPAASLAARSLRGWGTRAGLALLAACAAVAVPASASAETTLKFAHLFPATHYLWEHGGKVFADEVEKALPGRVKFQVYPAGQLGKDFYTMLNSGLTDMAIVSSSYMPDKFPLTSVAELPGLYSSACEGTNKLWSMAKPGGMLDRDEYRKLGMRMLFVTVLPPYAIMTTNKATPDLDALKGLKIRANGAAMEKTIRALGAVPVRVTSPELYDSLARGTVDGAFFPYQGLKQYDLQRVLKNSVLGPELGSGAVMYAMSEKGWNKLPPDMKAAFTKAAATAQETLCKWQDEANTQARKDIVSSDGHVVTNLAPAEAAKWHQMLKGVSASWAKEMDGNGKPGSALLKAFEQAPSK